MAFKPKRGAKGTDLGGQFIGKSSIAHALMRVLSQRGHHAAAKDLRENPPAVSAPKKRAATRWSPSDREVRGHARATAERDQLREQIARRDEDLKAPQFEGGRMANPAERRKAEMERAEYRRQLAAIEPRVAAGERNRALNPEVYADPLPGGDGPVPVVPGGGADLTAADGLSADPVVRQVQLANSAREAYRDLPKAPAGWVGLADLREHPAMRGLSREDQDAALLGVMKEGQRDNSARFTPIANRRTLTPRDHAAALDYGDPRHMVSLDDPSPRPLPGNDPATELASIDAQIAAMTGGGPVDHTALIGLQDRARELRPQVAASRASRPQPAAYDTSALSARDVEVDTKLRDAYAGLPQATGGWVGIADLRDAMGDIPRAEQDAALRRLADPNAPGRPRIIPVANTKALKPRDREAAVRIGDEDSHTVTFQEPVGSSDRQAELADAAFADEMAAELDAEFGAEANLAGTDGPSPAERAAQWDSLMGGDVVLSGVPGISQGRAAYARGDMAEARRLLDAAHAGYYRDTNPRALPKGHPGRQRSDVLAELAALTDPDGNIPAGFGSGPAKPAKKTAAAKVKAAKAATPEAPAGATPGVARYESRKINGQWGVVAIGSDGSARMVEPADSERMANNRAGNMDAALERAGRAPATPAPVAAPAAPPAKKTAAAKVAAAKAAGPSTPRADLGAMSPAELRAAAVNDDPDLESALAGRSLSELRSIAYDANVPVPSGPRHTIGGVRQVLMDQVRDVDRRNPSTEGRREARLLGVANATARSRPAKKTAAAKVKAAKAAAPSTADHAARVMEFQDGDAVVRYLTDSKLTIPQLKALGTELGGSLVNMRGSKQQLLERIGAHVGDRHRPIMGFAGDWHRGTPTPVAPSAPVEISDAERARRAEILARPLAQPRAMRPEDGAGFFSADPEVQARTSRVLDEQNEARKALRASMMESPPKKSAATRVRAARATQVPAPVRTVPAPNVQQFGTFGTPITRYRNDGATPLFGSEPTRVALEPGRQAEVEGAIRQAYDQLKGRPGSLVSLTALRDRLGDRFTREEIDNVLVLMNRTPLANVVPESDQLSLTARDHTSSIIIGNQDKHHISIQAPRS